MRSSLLVIALASSAAYAQGTAPEAPEGEPVLDDDDESLPTTEPTPTAPPEPTPEPTPTQEPAPAPTDEEPAPGSKVVKVERARADSGAILGIEAGVGHASGTTSTIYGRGFGAGLILGYRYDRLSVAWHFRHSYSLDPKDDDLEGRTTRGALSMSSVLVRWRLLSTPVVEVMAGPSRMSMPVYVVGMNSDGQIVEGREVRGFGMVVGGSVGVRLSSVIAIGLDLRTTVANRWELAGNQYVVPGGDAPGGGQMFTESDDDVTGTPWTATFVVRLMP